MLGHQSKQKAQCVEQPKRGEQDLTPHQPLGDSENLQDRGPKVFNISRCEEQPPPRDVGVLPRNPLPAQWRWRDRGSPDTDH